jgi:hypothetical protein
MIKFIYMFRNLINELYFMVIKERYVSLQDWFSVWSQAKCMEV